MRKMPTLSVMIRCISALSASARSTPLLASRPSSFARSAATASRIRAVGISRSPCGLSMKSAMNSPTIMPATTVSATELPPSRLKPCMSQQAASPAANSPRSVGLSPVCFVRTPPMV
jgi:hypothetical protein